MKLKCDPRDLVNIPNKGLSGELAHDACVAAAREQAIAEAKYEASYSGTFFEQNPDQLLDLIERRTEVLLSEKFGIVTPPTGEGM
jgi:hypothetical protein